MSPKHLFNAGIFSNRKTPNLLRGIKGIVLLILLLSFNPNRSAAQTVCLDDLQALYPTQTVYLVSAATGMGAIPPNASTLLSIFGNPTSKVFLFDGTITIDANIIFSGCTIYFTSGSRIQVSLGKHLEMYYCALSAGCGEMWDGIYGPTGATTAVMTFKDCRISDMINGIRVTDYQTALTVDRDYFSNNYLSIYLFGIVGNASITENTFESNGTGLLPPYSGALAEMGIWEKESRAVTIGDLSGTGGNYFNLMHCGIRCEANNIDQDLRIFDATFNDITGESNADPFDNYRGAAIYGSANYIGYSHARATIGGSSYGSSSVTSSDLGYIFSNTDCHIANTFFTKVIFGIGTNGDDNTHHLDNNFMDGVYYGIRAIGVNRYCRVTGNIINTRKDLDIHPYSAFPAVDFDYPMGIQLKYLNQQIYGNNLQTCVVWENFVTLNAARGLGIRVSDINVNGAINANTVTMTSPISTVPGGGLINSQPTYEHAGISLQRVRGSLIEGNTITGDANTRYLDNFMIPPNPGHPLVTWNEPSGIFFDFCMPTPVVNCNHVEGMRYGFQVIGSDYDGFVGTANLKVQRNEFKDNNVGMMFKYDAFSSATPLPTSGFGQRIGSATVDNDNKFLASGTWEQYLDVIGPHDIKIFFYHDQAQPYGGIRRIHTLTSTLNADQSIAINPTENYDLFITTGGTQLCPPTYPFPFEQGGDGGDHDSEEMEQFVGVIRGANPGGLDADGLWFQTSNFYYYLSGHPELLDSNAVIDSFYTALQSSTFQQIRYADEAYNLIGDTTYVTDSTSFVAAVDNAFNAVAAISPSNQYEQNEKEIKYLSLLNKLYGTDTFSVSDRDFIETVAFSCFHDVGPAIFTARYLYQIYEGEYRFDGQIQCGGAEKKNSDIHRGVSNSSPEMLGNLSVYPNPTSGIVNLKYNTTTSEKAIFEVCSIYGQVVKRFALSTGTEIHTLDLSDLKSGLYYYQLNLNNLKAASGKLIIENK